MKRAVALAAMLSSGCSVGLLQTAKTQSPGTVSAVVGVSHVANDRYAAAGEPPPFNPDPTYFPEASLRVGISEHIDAGVGSYLGMGGRLDVKYSFLPREQPFAIAARAGVGVAADVSHHTAGVGMAGVLASYDVASFFTPYAGVTFSNHWISETERRPALAPGERYAAHTPWGDGVLQLAAGASLRPTHGPVGLMAEVGRWLPAQNDPGDGFRFVPTTLLVGGVRFCTDCP